MHNHQESITEFITESAFETQKLGEMVGRLAFPGLLILLSGSLGSGKTTLTQGVCWGLGLDEYARSPTFVLVNQYSARWTIFHIDLYRLDTLEEIADIGINEYLSGENVTIIEWAEKAIPLIPADYLRLWLSETGTDRRSVTVHARGVRHVALLKDLQLKPFQGGAEGGDFH